MKCPGKTMVWSWLTCLMVAMLSGDVRAAEPQKPVDVPNYRLRDTSISPDFQMAVSCPSTGIVAFSVTGGAHVSEGGAVLLGYQTTYTNLGGGWVNGGGTFIAPCTGLYSFTVSFVKDTAYYGGTHDDVFIHVAYNGVYKGYAWSGEDSVQNRNTGTYTVALFMNAGDYLQTYASSDGGRKRHISNFNLTGYLVKGL
jgi:hypothetical protein